MPTAPDLQAALRCGTVLCLCRSKAEARPNPRLGEQVDVRNIPDKYLKETKIEGGFETHTYQMQLLPPLPLAEGES